MREIPEWADTEHRVVGRHVTCGQIHYTVVAVAPHDEGELLVRHDLYDQYDLLWISITPPTNWFFVNVLDEIVKELG